MLGNRHAQWGQAGGIPVGHLRVGESMRVTGHQPSPEIVGELVQRRKADPEWSEAALLPGPGRRAGASSRRAGTVAVGGRRREQQMVRQRRTHIRPRADPPLQVTLVQQLIVGGEHRQPGHLELDRQRSAGRNSLPGTEQAPQNGPPKAFVDLPVDRNPGGSVDRKQRQKGWAGRGFHQ